MIKVEFQDIYNLRNYEYKLFPLSKQLNGLQVIIIINLTIKTGMNIDLKCILVFLFFQMMIPEAFAIVLAPNDTSRYNSCLLFYDMDEKISSIPVLIFALRHKLLSFT